MVRLLVAVAGVSSTAAVALGWLWLSARDDAAVAAANCNAEQLLAVLQSERLVTRAKTENYETLVADLSSVAEREREARAIADRARVDAEATTRDHEAELVRLSMEAFDDDIPDSAACLNVYVPESAVSGLRVPADDREGAGSGARAGANPIRPGAARSSGGDPAFAHFSEITYQDALTLWGRDRDTVETLNGRLRAIRELEHDVQ